MDEILKELVDRINDYIGDLIDVASMPEEDKANLKMHLRAAETILLANGNVKLQEFVGAIGKAVLSRF